MMLTLTPIASEAIRQLSAQTDDPEASGIRIAPGPETSEGTALELSLVEEPEPEDEKVDEAGVTTATSPPHCPGTAPPRNAARTDRRPAHDRTTASQTSGAPGPPPSHPPRASRWARGA